MADVGQEMPETRAWRTVRPGALLLLLYALESLFLLSAVAAYRKGDRPLHEFLTTWSGRAALVGTLALAAGLLVLIRGLRQNQDWKQSLLPVAVLNVWSIALMLASSEIAIRVFAAESLYGTTFAGTLLLPRSWEKLAARNRAILQKSAVREPFLVFDSALGWTNGPNRSSADYNLAFEAQYLARMRARFPHDRTLQEKRSNLDPQDDSVYQSSAEGLRSPRAGLSYARLPAKRRIALIGDSFTFGLEVRFDDTWGHKLEQALGQEFQVLNFGVDGYGVDQAYLRYSRDVTSWQPEVVILSIIDDDLRRTMCVYAFLCFQGSELPFPKPRFGLNAGSLILLSRSLPTPESLFARRALRDLPLIEYDPAFDPAEWETHSYFASYTLRFLFSHPRFRRWPVPNPRAGEQALVRVNAAVVGTFVRRAREHGSIPIVVYLPDTNQDLEPATDELPPARKMLEGSHIPYVDMTACLKKLQAAERFIVLHYSPAANAAVAECLRDMLSDIVGAPKGPTVRR
jgi:hypothetical protein